MRVLIFLGMLGFCFSSAIAFERKPLAEAYYQCGYEANKALLSGPGRQNLDALGNVMGWCMNTQGYKLRSDIQVYGQPCDKLGSAWAATGNINCYEKNDL